jgi:uncharacterized protein YqhQ
MEAKAAPMRVGGQALADGVFMRTEKAWAIARADGSIEAGIVPSNPLHRIPVLRILVSLGVALHLGIAKGLAGRRHGGRGGHGEKSQGSIANKRFISVVIASEVVVGGIAWGLDRLPVHGLVSSVLHALPILGALVAMRFVAPSTVWRYHGAEHKAVAAHEAGIALDDLGGVLACPRVHPRCGTNLVVLVAAIGIALQRQPALIQVVGFFLGVAVAAEVLTLAGRWPRSLISRILLSGGRLLQAHVTTQEPSPAEQVVACRALSAALDEHARLTAVAAGGIELAA